jgi:hypothetical protein
MCAVPSVAIPARIPPSPNRTFVDIFCGEIMIYLSILLLFFHKLRSFTSASRTNTKFGSSFASRVKTKFGSGCSCGPCLEPGFRYQTAARMRTLVMFWIRWCIMSACQHVYWVSDCCQNNARELMQDADFVELFVDIFCEEIMLYLSVLLLFFQKHRPLTSASSTNTEFGLSSASRLKTKFGSGCSCESCLEPGFGYQTVAWMRTLPMFWIS